MLPMHIDQALAEGPRDAFGVISMTELQHPHEPPPNPGPMPPPGEPGYPPIEEPEPDTLPDEEPNPNPDENPGPEKYAQGAGIRLYA